MSNREDTQGRTMVRDPVCDMEFAESRAVATADFEDERFYFCTDACHLEFERDPDRYAHKAAPEGREPSGPGPSRE